MLFRYQDKEIRVTTEDGSVFTGVAEVFPSGYGLHEFGREEESIQLGDVILFKSDIRSIEELSVLADELACSGISRILTGHCTGEHAYAFLRQRLGDQIDQVGAGFSWVF